MQNVCLGSDTNEIWQIEKLKSPVAKTLIYMTTAVYDKFTHHF